MIEVVKSISVLYSQVCVFDQSMENPYNDWTVNHRNQGFSWRPGSVSFATSFESGDVFCRVNQVSHFDDRLEAITLIRVPFFVPEKSLIECGSILSGFELSVEPGHYGLYYCDFGIDRGVSFSFLKGRFDAKVVRLLREERGPEFLLMEASPG